MEQWHRVELPAGVDASAVAAGAAGAARGELRLSGGRTPRRRPRPPPRRCSRACRAICGPRRSAPTTTLALQDPRTRGAGVRIADLEYYWTPRPRGPAARSRRRRPRRHRLPAVPQLRRRTWHRGLRRDGRQGQRLRRHRRRAGRLDARHLTDPRPRDREPAVHPVGGARLRRPVPLAGGRRPARAADRRPQRRHALRAAGVEPGQLRRDQNALRPRHRRRRDRRQRQRGSRLRSDAGPLRPHGAQLRRDRRRGRQIPPPAPP